MRRRDGLTPSRATPPRSYATSRVRRPRNSPSGNQETPMAQSLKVLVTGATGKQGGAVARRLIKEGHAGRGLTRKPDSPNAKALAGLGVELASGHLEDRASVDRALAGVD